MSLTLKKEIKLDEESSLEHLFKTKYFVKDKKEVKNTSGLTPYGTSIVVKVKREPKEEKTASGIIIKRENSAGVDSWESRQMSVILGQIVACGSKAYYDQGEGHPEVGDFVIIERYVKSYITGVDSHGYRVINDNMVVTKCEPHDYDVIG